MADEVKFSCMSCQIPLSADSADIGQLMECPSCHNTMKVPPFGVIPGLQLGDFTVEKLLGLGGMGEVWLANQESLHRKVALKVLAPELAGDEKFVKRFLQEVKIAGKLTHPNIVMAYQAGEQNGISYLAISFVDGKVLGESLIDEKPLSEHEALRITRDIAKALKYAWEKFHILHRDIKPDNIMLANDGTPMLMDMGISKITNENESLTMTGTILGTPNYISPEQARAEQNLDARSDQYSLGATLYHMLTGQLPYTATSAMGILAQHLTEPVPDPKKVNPDVSQECQTLIKTMMAKKREDRFNSWDEVISACDHLLPNSMREITPLPDSMTSITAPEKKKSKRNKYIIAALIVFLLLAVFSLKNKLTRILKENNDLKEQNAFIAELDKNIPPEKDVSNKLSETEVTPAKTPDKGPQVTQFKKTDDDGDDSTPVPDKKAAKTDWKEPQIRGRGQRFKDDQETGLYDDKIKNILKKELGIDDVTAEKLAQVMKRYKKDIHQVLDQKPDLRKGHGGLLRKHGEVRMLQQKVFNHADTILDDKQMEDFKQIIYRETQKLKKRRWEDFKKKFGESRR